MNWYAGYIPNPRGPHQRKFIDDLFEGLTYRGIMTLICTSKVDWLRPIKGFTYGPFFQ